MVLVLLLIVIGTGAYYIHSHPEVTRELGRINPLLLILLLLSYGILLMWWMGVYNATLALCGKPLKQKENMLLSIYSTLANFFLPLQSGPGVRAAYLKSRHKVPISSYILASLVYFGIYAIISSGFLFVASHYWWLDIPAIAAAAVISYLVIYIAKNRFEKKSGKIILDLSKRKILVLALFTFGQLLTQALIYGIELHAVTAQTHPIRDISYTGAANFSLFVSLTPGAIGFREAFLELSRSLHHFTTSQILAANVIDRGVFLVFLGILFLIMLATHAKDRFINPKA